MMQYLLCEKVYDTYFRWDMSKPMDFWEIHNCHTLRDIEDCALKKKFSCLHKPLLNVKLENVVLDELHLMLRITGNYTYFFEFDYNIIIISCLFQLSHSPVLKVEKNHHLYYWPH